MVGPIILRLRPGEDLRESLEARAAEAGASWFLCGGIGSFRQAMLRYAGSMCPEPLSGPLELLSLNGTVCADGAHVHALVADGAGLVRGGHICVGCIIDTTAELALMEVSGVDLRREFDSDTGYRELRVVPRKT